MRPSLSDQKGPPGDQNGPDTTTPEARPDALPKPVQEHLGRQLRSTYNADAQRPAFLGDPAVPPQFERLIRRIELGEKVHELGVEAVRKALRPDALVPGKPTARPKKPDPKA